jgi:hypothetical protein
LSAQAFTYFQLKAGFSEGTPGPTTFRPRDARNLTKAEGSRRSS